MVRDVCERMEINPLEVTSKIWDYKIIKQINF